MLDSHQLIAFTLESVSFLWLIQHFCYRQSVTIALTNHIQYNAFIILNLQVSKTPCTVGQVLRNDIYNKGLWDLITKLLIKRNRTVKLNLLLSSCSSLTKFIDIDKSAGVVGKNCTYIANITSILRWYKCYHYINACLSRLSLARTCLFQTVNHFPSPMVRWGFYNILRLIPYIWTPKFCSSLYKYCYFKTYWLPLLDLNQRLRH